MTIINPTGSKNLDNIISLSVDNNSSLGWFNNKISNIKKDIIRIDSNDLTYTIYIGLAKEGSLETDNNWSIKRVIDNPNSPKDIKNAVGSWTNRTSLVYS